MTTAQHIKTLAEKYKQDLDSMVGPGWIKFVRPADFEIWLGGRADRCRVTSYTQAQLHFLAYQSESVDLPVWQELVCQILAELDYRVDVKA